MLLAQSKEVTQKRSERPQGRLLSLYMLSAGGVLLITSLAKIFSALGHAAVLAKPDPLFGILFNHLLLCVGFGELAVASLCLTQARPRLCLGLLIALSVNFLAYRVGLWVSHWPGYCPCLGTLTETIHLSQHKASQFTWAVLIYLLTGGIYFCFNLENHHPASNPVSDQNCSGYAASQG